jgi:hypothetical protein
LHGQSFGELQTLASGAAELVGALVGIFVKTDKFELSASLLTRSRQARMLAAVAKKRAHCDIVEHGKTRKWMHDLESAADSQTRAPEGAKRCDRASSEKDIAGAQRQRPAD